MNCFIDQASEIIAAVSWWAIQTSTDETTHTDSLLRDGFLPLTFSSSASYQAKLIVIYHFSHNWLLP